MSRRKKNPAANQLLHISNTPVCVLCVSEQTRGMSSWWQVCPGRFLAMLWRFGITSELVCLVLYLHTWTCKTDILSNLRLSLWLKSGTCMHLLTHVVPPHLCPFPSIAQHVLLWLPACRVRAAWPTVGKLVGGDEPTERGNGQGGWAVWHLEAKSAWPRAIITTGNSVNVFFECWSSFRASICCDGEKYGGKKEQESGKWCMHSLKLHHSVFLQWMFIVKGDEPLENHHQLIMEPFSLFKIIVLVNGKLAVLFSLTTFINLVSSSRQLFSAIQVWGTHCTIPAQGQTAASD